jgi:MFS family permease
MLAGVLAGSGLLVNVMLVSKWFVKNRGLAVGLTVAGTSVGNAAMPQVNVLLIDAFGWRDAFLFSAALPLVLLPLVWFVMRERPEDLGLTAPGAETGAGAQPLSATGMRYRDALKTPNFWILAGVAMMTFYSVLGLLQHIYLYLLGRDFTPQAAASGLSAFAILGLVGKLIAGALAERLGRKRVFLTTLAVMCAGAWLILNVELAGIWLPIVLVGAGWGGLYTLLQLLAADIFGVRELGKILGTITVLDAIGGGLGPAVTGFLYDQSGSYALPFTVIAVLVTVALVAAAQIRIPERA